MIYGSNQPQATVSFAPAIYNNLRLDFFILYNLPPADHARALAEVRTALEAGTLRHRVGLRLPLERIVEAHEAVEAGRVTGNVVIEL